MIERFQPGGVTHALVSGLVELALASALLAGCSTVSDSPGLEEESGKVVFVTINPSMTFQKIRGFGVSGAWWPTEAGAWPDSQKRNFARLLFDPVDGIGISVYRYNYGAGADAKPIATDNMATDGRSPSISDPWRRTTGLEVSPGVFDLSLDTGALWFVKAAQEAGVRDIVGFVNSPPARFTSNGMVSGARDGLSNLDPARFRDFAKYLVEITRYLR